MFEFLKKKEETKANSPETNESSKEESLKRQAYYEAEKELCGNPLEKANTSQLSEKDFNYTERVEDLVKSKLNNPEWVKMHSQ